MHHPIVPLLAMTLLVAGCATSPEGNGQFVQVYKMGTIVTELDALSNAECRAYANKLIAQEELKGGLPEGAVLYCSSEPAPRSALPVKATLTHSEKPRVLTMWMWSLPECQRLASDEMKKDNKRTITCEIEKH